MSKKSYKCRNCQSIDDLKELIRKQKETIELQNHLISNLSISIDANREALKKIDKAIDEIKNNIDEHIRYPFNVLANWLQIFLNPPV